MRQLHDPPDDIVADTVALLNSGKPVRKKSAGRSRLHIDRPLPFLFLHQFDAHRQQRAAERLCTSNAAYLLTSSATDDVPLLNAIGRLMREQFGRFLLFELGELEEDLLLKDDSPFLAPFEVKLCSDGSAETAAAAETFCRAIEEIDPLYRTPRIEDHTIDSEAGKANSGYLQRLDRDLAFIKVSFAPIYKQPGRDAVYPELLQRLVTFFYDANLRAIDAFTNPNASAATPTHRRFGRKGVIEAVHRVDRQIDEICASFDFLLAVTPINAAAAWAEFSGSDFQHTPRFLYRPLPVDIEATKRKLFSISLDHLEDPVLERLYQEKQEELDVQLTMLRWRNSPKFRDAGTLLYRPVEDSLRQLARDLITSLNADTDGAQSQDCDGDEWVDSAAVVAHAEDMVADYRSRYGDFVPRIEVRDDVPAGLMVSGSSLLVSSNIRMRKRRIEALLSHEIGVHLLTYFNGDAQELLLFRDGLAGYEALQEGLAVFAEYAVGGLTSERLKLLAARVLACDRMLDGATFIDTFRFLQRECGLPDRSAFYVTLRVYRGGGLCKDAIYLRGLTQVLEHLRNGGDLTPFWLGKIAVDHLPVVEELRARELLAPVPLTPHFATGSGVAERVKHTRRGLSPIDLVAGVE